jgi:hypothetical protein
MLRRVKHFPTQIKSICEQKGITKKKQAQSCGIKEVFFI